MRVLGRSLPRALALRPVVAGALAVVLAAGLAGCSSGDADPDRPGDAAPAGEATESAEPTLADRFYPDVTPDRVRVGPADYADPCQLLPPRDVIRLFGIVPTSGVWQTTTVRSRPVGDAPDAECWYLQNGFKVKAEPSTTRQGALSSARWRARRIGDGTWFTVYQPGAEFGKLIEELRGSSPVEAIYRFVDGTTTYSLEVELPATAPEEHFHGPARRAIRLVRTRLAQRDTLPQDLLGPVLRGEPYARGTRILDACDLLSEPVLEGLTGAANPKPTLTNTTVGWRHERGTHPDPKKWASPYTTCAWGTGERDAPDEYDVELSVRSHPDLREANRSFAAWLSRGGREESSLDPPSVADVDRGGCYSSTQVGQRVRCLLMARKHVIELTVRTGDRAPIRTEPDMAETLAAVVERVREQAG